MEPDGRRGARLHEGDDTSHQGVGRTSEQERLPGPDDVAFAAPNDGQSHATRYATRPLVVKTGVEAEKFVGPSPACGGIRDWRQANARPPAG